MNVELLHITPLDIVIKAIRTCYESMDKSDSIYEPNFVLGHKDKTLILKTINNKHESVLEHCYLNYSMSNYPRSLLQQRSRHRIASVSEKSTRYCLGKLKNEVRPFLDDDCIYNKTRVEEYIYLTGNEHVDMASVEALENVRRLAKCENIPNDILKHALPESFLSKGIFSINARSLRNFFTLRTDKHAMKEIRDMAHLMFDVIPGQYKFIFEDCIYGRSV